MSEKKPFYVYDYIDSHVRYFDKMYAKRLRTTGRQDFQSGRKSRKPKTTSKMQYLIL